MKPTIVLFAVWVLVVDLTSFKTLVTNSLASSQSSALLCTLGPKNLLTIIYDLLTTFYQITLLLSVYFFLGNCGLVKMTLGSSRGFKWLS